MDSKSSSRRKFIQKTSAVAGVTIIPSKSVWGACNASGVSGGSKDTSDSCSFSKYELSGRSPGSWDKFLTTATSLPNESTEAHGRDTRGLKKIHGMFSNYYYKWEGNDSTGNGRKQLKIVYDKINKLIKDTTISVQASGSDIPKMSMNLKTALDDNGGLAGHLASVYLNITFGFMGMPAGFTDAEDYIAHLWGVANVAYNKNYDLFSDDINSRYDRTASTILSI